ncbi:carboxymuconolactone decarboxylase family protein [Mycolicibacterium sp. YH-1]|uniref:carboxymuconolactone decarboxylase family protein n=1 Tax=Mycolicibacterium sp. YH-1 TaxID=2908837 RepID=UPI00352BE45E
MNHHAYDRGKQIRTEGLGAAYVESATAGGDEFTEPLQELINEYCWGGIWDRDGLSRKTRSILNLAMLSVLNRPHELRTHVRGRSTTG